MWLIQQRFTKYFEQYTMLLEMEIFENCSVHIFNEDVNKTAYFHWRFTTSDRHAQVCL